MAKDILESERTEGLKELRKRIGCLSGSQAHIALRALLEGAYTLRQAIEIAESYPR